MLATMLPDRWAYFARVAACALILGGTAACRPANGDSVVLRPPEQALARAEHVARIQVVDTRDANFDFDGSSYTCGSLVEATVVEALKGEVERVSFFASSEGHKVEIGRHYLAVVFRRTDEAAESLKKSVAPRLTALGSANLSCQIEAGDLFVKAKPETLLPFGAPEGPDAERVELGWLSALPQEIVPATTNGKVAWAELRRSLLTLLR